MRFSNDKVIERIQNDEKLSSAMSNFLLCEKKKLIEVLTLLEQEKASGTITMKVNGKKTRNARQVSHGYHYFQKPKEKGNGFRELTIPDDRVKALQENLAKRLGKISLSTAAIGGEKGFDHLKNAAMHKHNQYMYSTDLKNAFPSVDGGRIHINLKSALEKVFEYSYPYLNTDQLSIFVSALTNLVTYCHKLPQGSTTSTNLMNIVMAGMDKEIINMLHNEQNGLIKPTYTRYIDDIVIGYEDAAFHPHYKNKIAEELKELESLLKMDSHPITSIIEKTKEILDLCYSASSFSSKKEMIEITRTIKKNIEGRDKKTMSGNSYKRMTKLIEYVKNFEEKFEKGRGKGLVEDIKRKIRKILNQYGRQVQETKEHVRFPGSHKELREVTGITITPKGELGIPKVKMDYYKNVLYHYLHSPHNLPKKYLHNGVVNLLRLKRGIESHRQYIQRVKGKLPSDYNHRYKEAMRKLKETEATLSKQQKTDKKNALGTGSLF